MEPPLRAAGEVLGFGELTIEPARTTGEFLKLAVKAGILVLFTIDLTRIGAVIRSELVAVSITADSGQQIAILVPSRDLQLLFKVETFLKRRFLKARDAFDVKLLKDSGAALNDNLKAHLKDGPAADRLDDPEFIARRIDRVNARTCKPELQPYLPKVLYAELEKVDFKPLRDALRELFSEWL